MVRMSAAPSTPSVLILEESGTHTDQLLAQLRSEGGVSLEWERVNTLPTLREALERRRDWQLVVSAAEVAGLDTFQALAVTHEIIPAVPFVVLSRGGDQKTIAHVVEEWVTSWHRASDEPAPPDAAAEGRASPTQLFDFARRLLEAQEAERRHIARELHDEFGQLLTAVRLNLEAARREEDVLDNSDAMGAAIALVNEAIRKVRNFSIELWPTILDDLGLAPALNWLVENQPRAAHLQVRLRIAPLLRLARAVEVTCFRLVQESLTNVVRHAAAREVDIQLQALPGAVSLLVRDDGTGFDVPSVRRRAAHGGPPSFGLLGMQERVLMVGGQFQIQSVPGAGTTITARFPVRPMEAAQ